MKNNYTMSTFNINNKKPFLFKLKNKKSYEINQYNNINTFSTKEIINPIIKKFFHSKLNMNHSKNINIVEKNNNFKKRHHSHSLFNKKIHLNIDNYSSDIKYKTITKNNTFKNFNYIDNLKLQKNYKNIFYKKENILLIKPFHNINNQIREKINNIIINRNKQLIYDSNINKQLNNNYIDKNKNKHKNNKKNINPNEIGNKKKNNKKIIKSHNNSYDIFAYMFIKKRKSFNCINSKIMFPYFFKDNNIMNNFANKNYLEFKHCIETK